MRDRRGNVEISRRDNGVMFYGFEFQSSECAKQGHDIEVESKPILALCPMSRE